MSVEDPEMLNLRQQEAAPGKTLRHPETAGGDPTIAAAYLYRNGKRVGPVTLDHCPPTSDKSEFIWIGLVEPTDEELFTLQKHYHLHPLAVEDALRAHQLPKVDVYGDQLFVLARTAHLDHDNDCIVYGETSIFAGVNHIITVRHGSLRGYTDLRSQLEAAPTLLNQGVDYVLHAILDFIVDGYLPLVEDIEESVLEMEDRAIETGLVRSEVIRIFSLRRELIRFRRMLRPMSEMTSRLVHLNVPCLDPDVRPYFQDVFDHVRRVEAIVENLIEVLTSVFEVSNLIESQRQNIIMRKLAAYAAMLAVPTMIAGIYGMNFEHMPELHWRYGYLMVWLVIIGLCGGLYVRFKRMQWL